MTLPIIISKGWDKLAALPLRPAGRIAKGTLFNMRTFSRYKPIPPTEYASLFKAGRIPANTNTLYHGGAPGLSLNAINPMRIGGKQRKLSSKRTWGGFYATPDISHSARFGIPHKLDISEQARVLHTTADTGRMSLPARKALSRKYDIVAGRDLGAGGAPESVILNKGVIRNVSPANYVKQASLSVPIIVKKSFDSGDLYYDKGRGAIRNSRAWSNRDRTYIDRTIDDDARDVEFGYDQSGDGRYIDAIDKFPGKKDLIAYLDKHYDKNKGSEGYASWAYDPKEEDRAEVDRLLQSERKGELKKIDRMSRSVGAMTAAVGAGLGAVGGLAMSSGMKSSRKELPFIGGTLGLLLGGGITSIARNKQKKYLDKRLPKTFDEYTSKEILGSPIGVIPRHLPEYLKDYDVLDSDGSGHGYLVKSKIDGKNYYVDNESYWDYRGTKGGPSIEPTKADNLESYFEE